MLRALSTLLLFALALSAQPQPPQLTESDASTFLDGLMPMQLQRENIAGAVITIVKDGKVLVERGYGYADVEKKVPVSPTGTFFRPGSISKLFTWTSVMQQVEQGKLDLDRDVNQYLDFVIPPAFGQPITLRQVMTHTAGFEETGKELFVSDPKDMQPLHDYLTAHMPRRIFPPGTVPAYSNYATALAGYVVQRVSGEPFEAYVENHILKPLRMEHTTFRQPVPEAWKPMLSSGYRLGSGKSQPFELVNAFPAGSVSTTGDDMTRFMIAHLQDGEFEGRRILQQETARKMHSRAFGLHPALNGMALGFYEESRNGHRIIGHGGDTVFFHSDLHLVAGEGLGFFVSYNSAGKGEISGRSALWQKFFDRYYPEQPSSAATPLRQKSNLKELEGYYTASRGFETALPAITTLLSETHVEANDDGTLSTGSKGFNGEPKKYREVSPLVFRDEVSHDMIAFRKLDTGAWQLIPGFPVIAFVKAPWHRSQQFYLFVTGGSLVIIALALIVWPVGAILRRHYGRPLQATPRKRRLRLATRLVCLLIAGFLGGWLTFAAGTQNPAALTHHKDPWLIALALLGCLMEAGTLATIMNARAAWQQQDQWFWAKVGDSAVAVACTVFAVFALYWNMISFNLNY